MNSTANFRFDSTCPNPWRFICNSGDVEECGGHIVGRSGLSHARLGSCSVVHAPLSLNAYPIQFSADLLQFGVRGHAANANLNWSVHLCTVATRHVSAKLQPHVCRCVDFWNRNQNRILLS